jgi:hypothetical protein
MAAARTGSTSQGCRSPSRGRQDEPHHEATAGRTLAQAGDRQLSDSQMPAREADDCTRLKILAEGRQIGRKKIGLLARAKVVGRT